MKTNMQLIYEKTNRPVFVFFIFLLCLIYLSIPASQGPLILDSVKLYALENHVQEHGMSAIWTAVNPQGYLRRFISYATFNANVFLDEKVLASHMKWTNIMIHFIISILIFIFIKKLANSFFSKQKAEIFALMISALWLFSPVNLSTAFYTIQRIAQLSTFFVVLGLVFYTYARDTKVLQKRILLFGGVFVSLVCAFMSKENGVLLLPLLVLVEGLIWRFQGLYFSPKVWVMFISLSGLLMLLIIFNPGQLLYYSLNLSFELEILFTQMRVLVDYLIQIILPFSNDTGIYNDDFSLSKNLISPITTLFAALFHLCVIIFASVLYSRKNLIGFGILFFYTGHLIESTILPLEIYFLHRNYLPSIGIFIAIAAVFEWFSHRIKIQWLAVVFMIYMSLFVVVGYAKSQTWSDRLNVYTTALYYHPDSPRALSNYSQILTENNYYEQGQLVLDKILLVAPEQELRTKLQKFYVQCLSGKVIGEQFYHSIANTNAFGRSIEVSQALKNILKLYEMKKCMNLDINKWLHTLDSLSLKYKENSERRWYLDYYSVMFLYTSGEKNNAFKKLELLFSQGNIKAGHILYDLLIKDKQLKAAEKIHKLLFNNSSSTNK